ncbi:MAG: PEP-CTERM sorting domain-containing protein [Planctomycetota bacterium]
MLNRITSVVAVSAAMLAGSHASAQVVELDFEPDISVGQGFFQNITLLGTIGVPGDQDFAINNFTTSTATVQQIFMPFFGSTVITTGGTVGSTAEAAMLMQGDVIDATTVFGGPNSFVATFADQGLAAGQWYDPTDPVTGIAGFSFVDGPNTHYGWVEVTVSPDNGGSITIDRAAYNLRPDVAVVVPEPTTLAGFALAGLGMLARRRR